MQVTHVQDHVTHAIIGGGEAVSFGMSDSAEFFNVLSNALYSRKEEAVVRETLCNAWDAHIEAGRTNLPIEINITNENKLMIRDYGRGIADEHMEKVYCLYGGSTKKHDGRQTGGFGLGCKAPFAYAEHFEVTSHHKGLKSIYRMSKSSGEVGGKPGMTKIVTLPTDESGIQVSLDIKHSDAYKFRDLIRRIVANGGMNARLNGEVLPTYPFGQTKHGFTITSMDPIYTQQRLMVRYGNVIYPVEEHDSYLDKYKEITKILDILDTHRSKIVFEALPHTISVTPSRESLSMTDLTVGTLSGLLQNFIDLYNEHMEKHLLNLNQEGLNKAWGAFQPFNILRTEKRIIGTVNNHGYNNSHQFLGDFKEISEKFAQTKYPKIPGFREKDLRMRIKGLIESGYGNRGKLQSFLSEYERSLKTGNPCQWFHKRLVAPLIPGLKAHPELSPNRLLVFARNQSENTRRFNYAEDVFTEVLKFPAPNFEDCLPYLRNMVILTHNRNDVIERAGNFPIMKFWLGEAKNSLVYSVQRSDDKVEAARAFFKERGFNVVDLTQRYKWDPPISILDKKETVKKVKKKPGLPLLSNLFVAPNKLINIVRFRDMDEEKIVRSETPEFLIKVSCREDRSWFDGLSPEETKLIVELFGNKGAIYVTDTQRDKYPGIPDFDKWVMTEILREFKANTRIQAFFGSDPERATTTKSHEVTGWASFIHRDKLLADHFGIGSGSLTENDTKYLSLYKHLVSRYTFRNVPCAKSITDFIGTFSVNPAMQKLVTALEASLLLPVVDRSDFRDLLENKDILPATKRRARELLVTVIEG